MKWVTQSIYTETKSTRAREGDRRKERKNNCTKENKSKLNRHTAHTHYCRTIANKNEEVKSKKKK